MLFVSLPLIQLTNIYWKNQYLLKKNPTQNPTLVRGFLCPCVGPIPTLGLIPDGIIGYENFTASVLGLIQTWNRHCQYTTEGQQASCYVQRESPFKSWESCSSHLKSSLSFSLIPHCFFSVYQYMWIVDCCLSFLFGFPLRPIWCIFHAKKINTIPRYIVTVFLR